MLTIAILAAAAAAAATPAPVRVDPPLNRQEIRAALTERMGQRQLDLLIAGIVGDDGQAQVQAARAGDGRLAYAQPR